MARQGEKEDDREFFSKHQAFGIDQASAGWFDSVLTFDDLHGEANEVCAPFVEHTGVTIEGLPAPPTKYGPQTWKLNFFPQKTGAMLSSLKARYGGAVSRAAQQGAAPGAGGAGALWGVETELQGFTIVAQRSTIAEQSGTVVSIDKTDVTVPYTDSKCQLDARAIFSNIAEECDIEDVSELCEAKVQCSNWAVKAQLQHPEGFDKSVGANLGEYIGSAARGAKVGVSVNASPWLQPVCGDWTAALLMGGAPRQGPFGFRGWGVNCIRTPVEGRSGPLERLGLGKVTAAVTYERDCGEDYRAVERLEGFWSTGCGAYTCSASAELKDGPMIGVSVSPDQTDVGCAIPIPEKEGFWKSALLRVRHGLPHDADVRKQVGLGFAWQGAQYAAEVCVQLRAAKDGGGLAKPRVWAKISLGGED